MKVSCFPINQRWTIGILFSCFVFLRFFKMWIILKVFIEFVTILLLLYIFLFFSPRNVGQVLPGGSVVKKPPASAGDSGSTPGPGRSRGGGDSNPPQCSCLENPMDRAAWRATARGGAKRHLATKHEQVRDLSSWTRGQTRAPALEGEALPLDRQVSPWNLKLRKQCQLQEIPHPRLKYFGINLTKYVPNL